MNLWCRNVEGNQTYSQYVNKYGKVIVHAKVLIFHSAAIQPMIVDVRSLDIDVHGFMIVETPDCTITFEEPHG